MLAKLQGLFECEISKNAKYIILWTCLISASLALIIGIVVTSIGKVDYLNNAIRISKTEQRVYGNVYHNQAVMIGSSSKLVYFPSGNFQLAFTDSQNVASHISQYPSIIARTIEGTKLKVQIFVSGTISPLLNYPQFYKLYGEDWRTYLKFKIQNVLRRYISNKNFYDISNTDIITNTQDNLNFDDFTTSITNLRISLMQNVNMTDTTSFTIGQTLVQNQAVLNFINQTYFAYTNYSALNLTNITLAYTNYGNTKAFNDAININSTNLTLWNTGFTNIYNLFKNDSTLTSAQVNTLVSSYLWVYFQSFFNQSFIQNRSALAFS